MARVTLTEDQIVRTAIELLDDEGLDGLNMRALGKRLNSAATAVYWHVGSKEHLLSLAGDRLWGELPLPDPGATGWREAATAMATAVHAMLTAHPWLVQAFGSYVMFGPGKARHDDHSLALFERGGFAGVAADRASAAVFTYVLGNAMAVAADASLRRRLARDGGDAEARLAETMARAREVAAQFPRLRQRLDTAAADYAAAPAHTFETGLEALLDGLHKAFQTA